MPKSNETRHSGPADFSDSGGDKLWRYFFGKPPAETNLSPASKALLKEALIFKPRRDVARVIFISTPHRGSMIAQEPIGRFASSLIHKPFRFAAMSREIFGAVTVQQVDPQATCGKPWITGEEQMTPVLTSRRIKHRGGPTYHSKAIRGK